MFYTIGHSSLTWDDFYRNLSEHGIEAIVDVRSSPRSRFSQFNRPVLRPRLNDQGLSYIYMGDELGGHAAARLGYEATALTPMFESALGRVIETGARCRLALMCSEHEPLECHRCLIIGRSLANRGVEVGHILRDGRVEPHDRTEDRLLAKLGRSADPLRSPIESLHLAYRKQALKLGVKP